MIKDILQKFANTDLYSASLVLLEEVGVKINQETCEPIDIADFYDGEMPKYLQNALTQIGKSYYIGVVNDETLAKTVSAVSLQDEQQKVLDAQGKYNGMFIFAMDANNTALN